MFLLDGKEQLEFIGQFFFRVEPVGEVDSSDSAVGVDLHAQSLDVARAVGSAGEVGQVELDLVPALVESHGHGADEGLHAGGALVVRSSESSLDVFVIQDLHLEGEVLL